MDPNQQVAEMERAIRYSFNDRELAIEALFQGGIPVLFNGTRILPQRNERLAIMGDRLLDLLLIRRWYTTETHSGRLLCAVEWTGIIRDDLVTNKKLAARGRELGLDACVIKDPGTSTVSDRMMATTLEAIIAAVYKDSGFDALDAVYGVVDRLGFFQHPLFSMMINLRCLDPG